MFNVLPCPVLMGFNLISRSRLVILHLQIIEFSNLQIMYFQHPQPTIVGFPISFPSFPAYFKSMS